MTLHQAECTQCHVTLGSTTPELTLFSRDVSLYHTELEVLASHCLRSFRAGLSNKSSRSAGNTDYSGCNGMGNRMTKFLSYDLPYLAAASEGLMVENETLL